MKCPKCGSSNATTTLVKTKKGCFGSFFAVLMLSFGLLLLFGPYVSLIVGAIAAIVVIIMLIATPKHSPVSVCQECGCAFDPRSGFEAEL